MQSGFFDELLKQEENDVKELEKEMKEEKVAETPKENDVEEINFGDLSGGNQQKEEKKVEEPVEKSSVDTQTNSNFDFKQEKVEKPIEEKKIENTPKNEEPKKPVETKNQVVKKDFNQTLIENTLNKIADIVTYSNENFTPQAKIAATDIITSIDHSINERGYNWKQIDAKGSGLIMQIKKWAKLGVDCSNDKLYADIRKNGNTGLYDIKVKGQYQTVERLMIQYCRKKIFKFKTEIICIGDQFKTHFDYETGKEKVIDFVKNAEIDRNDLNNIIGAFKIAYYEENGNINQVVTYIEKDRIMDAYNLAPTKNIWKKYPQKMVKKTVTWEMYNGEDIRPFMDYPADIKEDLTVINETEDFDFNKEHKFHDVIEADNNANKTLGTGEEIGFNE